MGNCNRSNMGQRECGERYDMSSCQDFALAMAYVPWQHFLQPHADPPVFLLEYCGFSGYHSDSP